MQIMPVTIFHKPKISPKLPTIWKNRQLFDIFNFFESVLFPRTHTRLPKGRGRVPLGRLVTVFMHF